jgi:hypothetical protein
MTPAALGGDGEADRAAGRASGPPAWPCGGRFSEARRHEGLAAAALLRGAVGLDGGVDLGAALHGRGVVDLHVLDLVEGELGAAVLAEHADGVGAALAAVAHHGHVAGARPAGRSSSSVGPRWPIRP